MVNARWVPDVLRFSGANNIESVDVSVGTRVVRVLVVHIDPKLKTADAFGSEVQRLRDEMHSDKLHIIGIDSNAQSCAEDALGNVSDHIVALQSTAQSRLFGHSLLEYGLSAQNSFSEDTTEELVTLNSVDRKLAQRMGW